MRRGSRASSRREGSPLRKGVYLIVAVVLSTIALTWLVWHQTWFGARLDDSELIEAMSPASSAREAQHGIEEITRRFDEGRPGMDRWATALVEVSRRADDPVRVSAAWAMQFDAGREEFVVRLHELIAGDASMLVRRNAAGSLAKAGDPAGRPVLRSMLEPFTVAATDAGVVSGLLAPDMPARSGAIAGRIARADGTVIDARVTVPGRVIKRVAAEGARVAPGDPLLVLAPDPHHALNAVAGLALVGTIDDLELLSLSAAPQSGLGDDVRFAATQAMAAIRSRGK